jgi:hypothetical protein
MSVCMIGSKIGIVGNDGSILRLMDTLNAALHEMKRMKNEL